MVAQRPGRCPRLHAVLFSPGAKVSRQRAQGQRGLHNKPLLGRAPSRPALPSSPLPAPPGPLLPSSAPSPRARRSGPTCSPTCPRRVRTKEGSREPQGLRRSGGRARLHRHTRPAAPWLLSPVCLCYERLRAPPRLEDPATRARPPSTGRKAGPGLGARPRGAPRLPSPGLGPALPRPPRLAPPEPAPPPAWVPAALRRLPGRWPSVANSAGLSACSPEPTNERTNQSFEPPNGQSTAERRGVF